MKKELIVAVFVCVLAVSIATAFDSSGEKSAAPMVLIDMGNGDTYWTDADTNGTTYKDVLTSTLGELGLTYSFSGKTVIEGRGDFTVKSNSSSKTVNTSWKLFEFEGGKWVEKSNINSKYDGGTIAFGYYPAGITPAATPANMETWTQVRGNSSQDGHQTADIPGNSPGTLFEKNYGKGNFVCGVTLVADGKVIIVTGGTTTEKIEPKVYAYDQETMKEVWSFEFPTGMGYEIATGAIIGDYYYLPATNGNLYKISLANGKVEYALYDEAVDKESKTYTSLDGIPKASYRSISPESGRTLTGMIYNTGSATIVYDYGTMFFGTSSGYIYAVDPVSMNVLWKAQLGGRIYYTNVTVSDGLVYAGALDGKLYVFEASTGKEVASALVHTKTTTSKAGDYVTGSVTVPYVAGDTVYVGYTDGRGMNSTEGGVAIYTFDRTAKTLTRNIKTDTGLIGNYFLPVKSGTFDGVYFTSVKIPIGRIDSSGNIETVFSGISTVKAAMVLVNGGTIYISEYNLGGYLYAMTPDGEIIGKFRQPDSVRQWAMSAPVITSNGTYVGTDGGFYAVSGDITIQTEPDDEGSDTWMLWVMATAAIIILLIIFIYLKARKSNVSSFNYVK